MFLHLDNFNAAYRKPCIMDIKMGKTTSDPDATPEKIACEKAKGPLREIIGFQICGIRVVQFSTPIHIICVLQINLTKAN